MEHWRLATDAVDTVLEKAAGILRAGGVVGYPTDTLYGLGADPWSTIAIARVFAIKGREAVHPLPLIAADLSQIEQHLGRLPEVAVRLAAAFWPGPLTLVVPAPATLPALLLGAATGVAVRVPAHRVAADLARTFGRPIVATSANHSGKPATARPEEVAAELGRDLDALVDAGPAPGGPPSTIVDVCASPRLVRAGAIEWERVVQFLAL